MSAVRGASASHARSSSTRSKAPAWAAVGTPFPPRHAEQKASHRAPFSNSSADREADTIGRRAGASAAGGAHEPSTARERQLLRQVAELEEDRERQMELRKGAQRLAEEARGVQCEASREAARERFIRERLEKESDHLREELRQARLRQNHLTGALRDRMAEVECDLAARHDDARGGTHLTGELRDRMAEVECDLAARHDDARGATALLSATIEHLAAMPPPGSLPPPGNAGDGGLFDALLADLERAAEGLEAVFPPPGGPGGGPRGRGRAREAALHPVGARRACDEGGAR
ncbi:hypothetical protein T484DRAFT_1898768, partial [Baffinella frigidus]